MRGLGVLGFLIYFSAIPVFAKDYSPPGAQATPLSSFTFPVETNSITTAVSLRFSAEESTNTDTSDSFPDIHLNGEGGLAIFDTGDEGDFPNNEFRVDEAKLFVEAQVWKNIYAFGELNLLIREGEDKFKLGELYVDFENVSKLWNQRHVLNVRVGRFDIPFGEEYLTRDAIDNPLISHFLSDFWGVDEGIQVYGTVKLVQYNLAVQNGGPSLLNDFNPDKAVTGRLEVDAQGWLHVSFSAMRTGDLDVEGDQISELWFGNGFIRSIGSSSTTTAFHANLIQGDGQIKWPRGHFYFGIGHVNYDDNDSSSNNHRDASYYQIEGLESILQRDPINLYLCARFSRIDSSKGFPLVGHGDFGKFFFNNAFLTEKLCRFSIGPGYRIGNKVLLKAEYAIERGRLRNGDERPNENFWGAEVALKF